MLKRYQHSDFVQQRGECGEEEGSISDSSEPSTSMEVLETSVEEGFDGKGIAWTRRAMRMHRDIPAISTKHFHDSRTTQILMHIEPRREKRHTPHALSAQGLTEWMKPNLHHPFHILKGYDM